MRDVSPEAAADRHDDPAGRCDTGSSGGRHRRGLADDSGDGTAAGGIGTGCSMGPLSAVRQMAGLEYRRTLSRLRDGDFLGLSHPVSPAEAGPSG